MAVWYDDSLKLRDFASALQEAEYADEDDVLKKPYKFDNEYEKWVKADYPSPEDPNWDDFIEALNEQVEGE
jgi:hypothetical protein